jgi:hypothetical protein
MNGRACRIAGCAGGVGVAEGTGVGGGGVGTLADDDTGSGGAVSAADTIVSSFVPSFGQNLASSA